MTTQRIRIVGGPWPERIGCTGVTVTGPNRYPWAKLPKSEVVILLDEDPLGATHDDPQWTCALSRRSVRPE